MWNPCCTVVQCALNGNDNSTEIHAFPCQTLSLDFKLKANLCILKPKMFS